MIYDGVMAFALALQQLGGEQVRSWRVTCDDPSSVWDKGFTIVNFMRNVKFVGLTGPVEFDTDGIRRNIAVDIIELRSSGFEKVGDWQWSRTFTDQQRLKIDRPPTIVSRKKKLRVITSLVSRSRSSCLRTTYTISIPDGAVHNAQRHRHRADGERPLRGLRD